MKILKKIKFEKYKGDELELKGKDLRKNFTLKKEKKDILGKKRGIEKITSKKDNKKIAEIKDIVKSSLLNKRENIKKIEKIIKIKICDAYKPKKIYGAFDDSYVEYKIDSYRDKSMSIARYLNNNRRYLKKMIDDKKIENGRFN